MSKECINALDFCRALKTAHDNEQTLQDVAKALNLKLESVYQRYAKLRKDGVNIPDIPMKPSNKSSVEELNQIFS